MQGNSSWRDCLPRCPKTRIPQWQSKSPQKVRGLEFVLNDGGPHYRWDKASYSWSWHDRRDRRERKEEAKKPRSQEAKKPKAAGGGNFRIPPKSEGAGHPGLPPFMCAPGQSQKVWLVSGGRLEKLQPPPSPSDAPAVAGRESAGERSGGLAAVRAVRLLLLLGLSVKHGFPLGLALRDGGDPDLRGALLATGGLQRERRCRAVQAR